MLTAGMVTILCHRFRQPVVLGYILAGFLIGPHMPLFELASLSKGGLINDEESIKTLAELGVIFLMFCLGLEFSGATAFFAAFMEILLMVWLGWEVGQFFGWTRMDSIFLGAILASSPCPPPPLLLKRSAI